MDEIVIYTLAIAIILFIIWRVHSYDTADINNNNNSNDDVEKDVEKDVENFMGGYYYPYDYPYYWPYFYSGCNENVFGDVKCLPFYAHPFW